MTKKQLMRVHLLFNDLVQKKVNGRLAYEFHVNNIDYLGGYEVIITTDCIIWLSEIAALQVICDNVCVQSCIELSKGRIEMR